MPVRPVLRRPVAALGLLAAVAAQPAAAADPWPTTRFDVVAEGPSGEAAAGPLSAATEASLEGWLSQVAQYYEGLGFRPPALEPLVATPDGGRAYEIYLFDLMRATGLDGVHVSPCGGATPRLMFNHASLVAADGGRTDRSWTLVAHELFHAVQAAYPMFAETCDRGDWITEGTAEAIGLDTAWRLAGVDVYPDLPTMRWGGRRYDEPLPIRRNGERRPRDAYRTASFWRYLGEVRAAGAGQPGPARLAADYGYLHEFFEAGDGLPGTAAAELDWLHRGTTGLFGIGLPMMLTAFSGTLESWVPARGASPGRSPDDNRRAWRRALFGGCTPVFLSPDDPTERVIQALEPVTADCFAVTAEIDGRAAIAISVAGGEPALFDQLIFGAAEGREILRPRVWQAADGPAYGLWQFSLPGGAASVVVVTNVATPPSGTGEIAVPVDFTLTSFESSLTTPTPEEAPPPDPGPSPPEPADPPAKPGRPDPPGPARDRVAEAAAERIAAGLAAASASANAATSVGRDVRAHPCAEPFVFLACGPSTRIGLMLLPGDALDMGATFGRGGIAGQFTAMVEGMQQRGMAEVLLAQRQAMERLASTAGAEIRITIPLIDYGFSGSFANAQISVTDGEGGALVSQGPGDAIAGRGRGYPLTGRVTIEQFTPTLMTGSFSGDLVDPGEAPAGDDAPRTVVASVEGRFTIATPLTGDGRFRMRDPADPMAEAREDLAMAFPQLRGVLDQALSGRGGGPVSTPGGAAGGGAAAPACDCSCNDPEAAAAARPDCVPRCEATWAACTAEPPAAVSPASAEDIAAEAAEIAALRDRFAEGLARHGWPDAMVDGILETFDALETLGEKRFYMMSMGVPPPPEDP